MLWLYLRKFPSFIILPFHAQLLLTLMAFEPFVASFSFPASAPGVVIPANPWEAIRQLLYPPISAHLVPFPKCPLQCLLSWSPCQLS